jgi:FkbM family methyltransferase
MEYGPNPEVIIDCGANVGLVSLFYKRKFPKATIVAVEPEPTNFKILSQNTAAYPDIHCLNCGIWNKPAILEIHDHGLGKWGFMTEEVEEENDKTIQAISIDEIMSRFNFKKIDILKVDIEGSEKEMFEKNYEKWLPYVKVVVIELHDNMRPGCASAFFKALSNYNFEFKIHGHNIACFFK